MIIYVPCDMKYCTKNYFKLVFQAKSLTFQNRETRKKLREPGVPHNAEGRCLLISSMQEKELDWPDFRGNIILFLNEAM